MMKFRDCCYGFIWHVLVLIHNIIDIKGDHALFLLMGNEPAERRRSAGEAAENSPAQRMLYAEKFSLKLPKVM